MEMRTKIGINLSLVVEMEPNNLKKNKTSSRPLLNIGSIFFIKKRKKSTLFTNKKNEITKLFKKVSGKKLL
ncbi:MAG: Unknown protein [uncultured Aureispira sp.]|uniref:Uncharacterized protein n=1 Tax=uncultured Aureispira sp. TaxID=1331704 RepID=A0A6S6S8X1_9BACT|nr:MAG: Unknown protein [uncultured Aureispira sp.]